MKTQRGFAAIEILILVPLVIILVVVAAKVYQNGNQAPVTNQPPAKTTTSIATSTDLDEAGRELDQINIDEGASEAEISEQAATF